MVSISQNERWRFLKEQDFFWSIEYWPRHIAGIAVKDHPSNLDRLNFLYFLLQNGLDPEIARHWIYLNRHNVFDSAAKYQIDFLLKNYAKYNYRYFDMFYVCYRNGFDVGPP